MKRFSYFCAIFMMAALCSACSGKKQDPAADEKAIKSRMEEFQAAFNHQDAKKLSSLWSSNAIYSNPATGEVAEGREAIAKLFKEKFEYGKEKQIEFVHKNVKFSPDEAIEQGLMKVTIAGKPAKQVAFQMTFIKEKGKWLIDQVNQIEVQPAPSNFEHLSALAWFTGEWKNGDPNVEVAFIGEWDQYKNFLTQHFAMKVYGQDDLKGKQIIAWDPIEKKIRSWVFDSDGGFGEGTWTKVDKSWYASMKYKLSDGRTATATNVYTPIDDHTYTFASVEREVAGQILPNMNPVKVEKVQ